MVPSPLQTTPAGVTDAKEIWKTYCATNNRPTTKKPIDCVAEEILAPIDQLQRRDTKAGAILEELDRGRDILVLFFHDAATSTEGVRLVGPRGRKLTAAAKSVRADLHRH
jgi:hypothetical protein